MTIHEQATAMTPDPRIARYESALQEIASVTAFECDINQGFEVMFRLCRQMRRIAIEALQEPMPLTIEAPTLEIEA